MVLVSTGCTVSRPTTDVQRTPTERQQRLATTGENGLSYLLYLPRDYSESGESWPLLLFLHGMGERGDSLDLVKMHGPPKLIEQEKDFPFVVVSPQAPSDKRWEPASLDHLLTDLEANLNIDSRRIYVTGLSMGGFGTWDLAFTFPNRFAAIAPVCGGGDPAKAALIKDLPAWVFHGSDDPVVPARLSREMVDALRNAGADVLFTEYPETGHDSWTKTYSNPELYQWLLSKRR